MQVRGSGEPHLADEVRLGTSRGERELTNLVFADEHVRDQAVGVVHLDDARDRRDRRRALRRIEVEGGEGRIEQGGIHPPFLDRGPRGIRAQGDDVRDPGLATRATLDVSLQSFQAVEAIALERPPSQKHGGVHPRSERPLRADGHAPRQRDRRPRTVPHAEALRGGDHLLGIPSRIGQALVVEDRDVSARRGHRGDRGVEEASPRIHLLPVLVQLEVAVLTDDDDAVDADPDVTAGGERFTDREAAVDAMALQERQADVLALHASDLFEVHRHDLQVGVVLDAVERPPFDDGRHDHIGVTPLEPDCRQDGDAQLRACRHCSLTFVQGRLSLYLPEMPRPR